MSRHQITPAWQTQRGGVVQAHGCAAGVPVAGARVFGNTRQNLWVNPSGTNSGVTVTANGNGSITVSGTSTNLGAINSEYVFVLRPNTEYTMSVDKSIENMRFGVNQRRADGSQIAFSHITSGNELFFTTSDELSYCLMTIGFDSGVELSGTYRVMLNEGSEAQPWCPPGLNSVSELGIVAAGKNLASNKVWKEGYWEANGVWTPSKDYQVRTPIPIFSGIDYTASLQQISDTNAFVRLIWLDESQGFLTRTEGTTAIQSKNIQLDVPSGARWMTWFGEAAVYDAFQIELGPSATAYEPPSVTTTPIDLSGHQLRSLPDGTRDVLTVDGSGAVSVEQVSAMQVLDDSMPWFQYEPNKDAFTAIAEALVIPQNVGLGEFYCDKLPFVESVFKKPDVGICFTTTSFPKHVYVNAPGVTSIEEFKSWIAENPLTVIYGAEPKTIPLDPIAPPSIPAADATLWAASDVPCELEATTWTASGAEQGRQQAAMVKVAQQVRQQAATVAALAAQSLEA